MHLSGQSSRGLRVQRRACIAESLKWRATWAATVTHVASQSGRGKVLVTWSPIPDAPGICSMAIRLISLAACAQLASPSSMLRTIARDQPVARTTHGLEAHQAGGMAKRLPQRPDVRAYGPALRYFVSPYLSLQVLGRDDARRIV